MPKYYIEGRPKYYIDDIAKYCSVDGIAKY